MGGTGSVENKGLHIFSLTFILVIVGIIASCGGEVPCHRRMQWARSDEPSDPPSCMPPNGVDHVYVTVRSVQAHIEANATDGSSGWRNWRRNRETRRCRLTFFEGANELCASAISSASLPVGSYQQIRLLLVSNSPAAFDPMPSTNACAGNGYNCVVLSDSSIHELQLSSQDNTGLKIPPGQIVGGPLQVMAGQSVDLNIDSTCASIVEQGNGKFRLKPTLTAAQVSANNSGIGGQAVDAMSNAPIIGNVQVAIEQPDGGESIEL